MPSSLAGMVLVASPTLLDPNFHRTVVYLVEHNAEGALGLVLNRPTRSDVAEHLDDWAEAAADPQVVFVGGPVAIEMAVCLVQDPGGPPSGWTDAVPGIGIVDAALPPAAYDGVRRARIFAGYAGWDEGQLEIEMATGSWVPLMADAELLFTAEPASLWRRVLATRSGRAGLYATFPEDPGLN